MDPKLVSPFVNATVNVLSTMASTIPEAGTPTVTTHTTLFGDVTGIIGLAGEDIAGNLLISFDQQSILAIVSRMLMEKFDTLNHEVLDAVGEITNMICGGAKRELSEHGIKCDLASPTVISGKNLTVQQMTCLEITSIPFRTLEGQFVVETNLGNKKDCKTKS